MKQAQPNAVPVFYMMFYVLLTDQKYEKSPGHPDPQRSGFGQYQIFKTVGFEVFDNSL